MSCDVERDLQCMEGQVQNQSDTTEQQVSTETIRNRTYERTSKIAVSRQPGGNGFTIISCIIYVILTCEQWELVSIYLRRLRDFQRSRDQRDICLAR